MPSVRQHARERGVSNETVLRAYDKLVAHGLLEPRRGAGFYVKRRNLVAAPLTPDLPSWMSTGWQRLLRCEANQPGAAGLPTDFLDRDALTDALRQVARLSAGLLSGEVDPRGYGPLREQLQIKLQEAGIRCVPSQIMTTAGAAEALHLVVWSHFYPGQFILVEEPCSFLHVQRLLASGLEVVKVPRKDDGPDIEALYAACERYAPKAFLCSSILHNPTSTSMAPHVVHQVLKVAEAFDLLVIDDDSYGDLWPPGSEGTAHLATLDQLGRVVHIGGFSRTMAPGLRSGFIAASPARIEKILSYRSISTLHGSILSDFVVHRILSRGRYRHHCTQLRTRLDALRSEVKVTLSDVGCSVPETAAGLYLWADLGPGANAAEVADALYGKGIGLAPAKVFAHAETLQSRMRFNVAANYSEPVMAELGDVLRELRRQRPCGVQGFTAGRT